MQLLVLESTDDDPERKSGVKGLGAVTTSVVKPVPGVPDPRLARSTTLGVERAVTSDTTGSSTSLNSGLNTARAQQSVYEEGKVMYPFRVKHLGQAESYTLYAKTPEARLEWCQKILEAKTAHAASLHEQNAEPFRLRVMADTAFAYDSLTSSTRSIPAVPGTPLDRAIRQMESVYGAGARPGPVCRAHVNCATSLVTNGKQMVAIGTDYGVYISDAANPRGWTRVSLFGTGFLSRADNPTGYPNAQSHSDDGSCRLFSRPDSCRQAAHCAPTLSHCALAYICNSVLQLNIHDSQRHATESSPETIGHQGCDFLRHCAHEGPRAHLLQEARRHALDL